MLSSYTITTNINVLYNYCNNFNTLHFWSLANQLSLMCVNVYKHIQIVLPCCFTVLKLRCYNFLRYGEKFI